MDKLEELKSYTKYRNEWDMINTTLLLLDEKHHNTFINRVYDNSIEAFVTRDKFDKLNKLIKHLWELGINDKKIAETIYRLSELADITKYIHPMEFVLKEIKLANEAISWEA